MDWDGDGRSDLAYDNGGNVGVYLSTGRGFTSPISTSIPYASNFRVLDIDGDGLDDLARMEANVLRIHTRNAAGAATTTLSQFPDLLTSVVDGLGVSQSVTYVSTAHSNYSPGVQVPGLTPARARIVVSAATLPTGIVNPSTYMVTYSYVGAREDVLRATFMGFQEQHITDTRTNVLTRTYFRQAFPQTGWVWKTETFRDGDIKLAAHEITDDNIATLVSTNYRQRYFPYVESVRSEAYEPEGTERLITRSETTYGGIDTTNGNVGTITTSVEDGDGVTQWSSTTSIQYAPATTGCADLPSQISVTLDRTATPDPPAITRTVDFTKDGTHCRHRTQTLQGSSDKFDVTTTFGYDSFGNVSSTSVVAQEPSLADPNTYQPMPARQNTIYWGVYGLAPEAITNAVNETSLLGYYQTTGLLQSLTDPNGLVTSLEFDGFGRLTKQTRPDQTSIDLQYADCSGTTGCLSGTLHRMNVVQTERDATSAAVRQQYAYLDSFGRTLVTRSEALNGNFRWSEVQYDLLGRIAKSSIPCLSSAATGRCVQAWREFTSYDLLGRIKRIEQPANENEISRELVTLISYDGLTRTVTDPLSRTTSLRTDVSGNIVRSTDANGYYQNFFYDSAGNLTEVRESPQPGRSAVLFSATYDHGIDAFQRSISDRALGARTRWFDGFGQLRRWTDAKGQVFEASYDALSRPTIRREGVVSPSAQEMKITLTWGTNPALYNIGQIVSARSESVDGTYIENYGYDSRGRLSSHSISVPGEPTPYVYNYEYDSLTGLLETLTYPASTSGYRLALRYNTVGGILRSITDANAPSTVFWSLNDAQGGINALGQITHDRLGPIVRERQYDAVTGGLERLTAGSSGNPTALQNLSVGYDDFGNVWQRQNNLGSLTASLTENFRYGRSGVDLIDRLTQIDVTNAEGTRTRDIEHDAFGNIEMVTTPDSATPPDLLPVDLTFTWTSNNYPKTISAPWLSQNVSFAYGPHQQRWRMTFQEGETTETTYYLGMMEKVVTGTGTEFRHYIPGPDEIVALYARSGSSGSLRYVLSDHLGSVDTITDSAGAALVRSSFAAYGRPRDPTDWWGDPGSTASGFTRQGFTFHTVLAGMGLIHMNGRVHDAVSGTFISADPFVPYPTNTQSFNRYAYVRNNPLTYTDPTGFQDGRGCQGCMWGMVGDDISGMGPLEWGWALWEVYGGWSGYLWNVGGIDTGDYDCKGTYEECSRGWVASEFYTNEVTNPQHREFPAERRANTNVAAGTVNPGVDRRSSTAADSTVSGNSIGGYIKEFLLGALDAFAEAGLNQPNGTGFPIYTLTGSGEYKSPFPTPETNELQLARDLGPAGLVLGGLAVGKLSGPLVPRMGGLADDIVVVRGGTSPVPPPGQVFSGAYGRTLEEAASGVPHGQIRATTAGEIRAGGGRVDVAPELTRSGVLNERHVNICLGAGPCPFGPVQPNPVPKTGRIQ